MNPDMLQNLKLKKDIFSYQLNTNEKVVVSVSLGHLPIYYHAIKTHNSLVKEDNKKLEIILMAEGENKETIITKFSVIAKQEFKNKAHFLHLVDTISNYYYKYLDNIIPSFENLDLIDIREFLNCNENLLKNLESLNKFNTTFLNEPIELLKLTIDLSKEILDCADKIRNDSDDYKE